MPVYLFTYHAYRTWNADNPRGFVHGHDGLKEPNPALARAYDRQATDPPVLFDDEKQKVLLWITHDCCDRRDWRLHFVATETTHVHVLISWIDATEWKAVFTRVKNLASRAIGQVSNEKGRKWFVRRGSRKRIKDRQHFDYLVTKYLPNHRGRKWREGDSPPEKPSGISD